MTSDFMETVVDIIKKLAIPIILLLLIIGVIVGISNFQRRSSEPEVKITEPSGNFETDQEKIVVKGETNSLNNEIFINDIQAEISDDKTFHAEVPLSEGDNEIRVEVVTRTGRQITQKIEGKRTTKIAEGQNGEEIEGEKKTDGTEIPEKEVLGEAPQGPGAAPPTTQPVAPGEDPLTKAGPAENAAVGFGILTVTLYFYKRSRQKLSRAQGKISSSSS